LVWDFLSLTSRPKGSMFTSYPHLSLAIHADHLEVAVTIPNDVVTPVRDRLRNLGAKGLTALHHCLVRNAEHIRHVGGWIEAYAHQRHYISQSSPPITDAKVRFKLETTDPGGGNGVKHQPAWTELFASLLQRKRANIQFGYVVKLPWGVPGLETRESLELIATGWCAMKPLLDLLRSEVGANVTAPSAPVHEEETD